MMRPLLTFIALIGCVGFAASSAIAQRGDKLPLAAPVETMPDKAIATQAAHPIDGVWVTKAGKSRIKVKACGQSLCNEIIWLREPLTTSGIPKYDGRNQNEALRKLKRPIIGLSILLNTQKAGPRFWKGSIYDPERGKSYTAQIRLLSKDKLQVKGCLAWGFPCETHHWQRYVAPPKPQPTPDK